MKKTVTCCRLFLLICLVVGFTAGPSFAATIADVAHDMAPVEGRVLLESKGQYLVDLDASQRLAVGDLLALVTPGEKILHPVTGQVVGQITDIKGYLEVSRVGSGFSTTRLLSGAPPERGAKVRRFEGMKAYFRGEGAVADRAYAQLRTKLSQFTWEPWPEGGAAAAKGQLAALFQVKGARLTVSTVAGTPLRSYVLEDEIMTTSPKTSAPALPTAKQEVYPDGTTVVPKGIIKTRRTQLQGEFWRTRILSGSPGGMAVGRFFNQQQAVAIAETGQVKIFPLPLDETMKSTVAIEAGKAVVPLRVAAFDLDGDAQDELFVSARRDNSVASYIIDFSSGQGKIVAEDLPWFFARFEVVPGQWILAAQKGEGLLDPGSEPIFRVMALDQGRVELGGVLRVPRRSSVLSNTLLPQAEGPALTVNFDANDRLQLYRPGGVLVWSSDKRYGGMESYLPRQRGDDDFKVFLPAPLAVAPTGDLLVPMNIGTTLFRIRSFGSSHLKAMRVDAGELVEIWRTKKQKGYLVDFAVVDYDQDGSPNLLLLEEFSSGTIVSDGKYGLVAFELPQATP